MEDLKIAENLVFELGLTQREAKVYTTLFLKKDFMATEIQQLINIPRTKIYEVLKQLVNRGMCLEKNIGRNKRYEVIHPATFFDKLSQDLDRKQKLVDQAREILNSVYEERGESDNSLDYVEVITDWDQISKKFSFLQKNAKKEILGFSKSPYTLPITENLEKEAAMIKNGVVTKAIYEYKDVTNEQEKTELISAVRAYQSIGEEVKFTRELPMKLGIFDEKVTISVLNDKVFLKPSLTAIVINHPSSAIAQKYVFNSIWNDAITLSEFEQMKIEEFNSK